MYFNEQLLVLISISLMVNIKCQENQYEYNIEVPKYLCDKNGIRNGTTIRLLGKDAQKLQYDFTVDFKNHNDCKQRCTLMTWRAVRNLEKYLKNACATQENLQEISIDNTMLSPGIQYVLNISVTNKGALIDSKQFMLECTNETETKNEITPSKKNETVTIRNETVSIDEKPISSDDETKIPVKNQTEMIKNETVVAENETARTDENVKNEQIFPTSFILIGTNVTYRDMLYILKAEVNDCTVNCNYYFKWEILDNSGKLYKKDYTKSSELEILPDYFYVVDTYVIKCSLINSQDHTVITMASQNLTVLRRTMVLKLSVSTLLAGIKQPFKLTAYFRNTDNPDGRLTVEWSCKSETQKDCSGFENAHFINQEKSNFLSLESNGLFQIGSFHITVSVSDENSRKQDTCTLTLTENIFMKIDIDSFEEPVDPSKDIDVPAFVSGLIATCSLQWVNVKASLNYHYLNSNFIIGNVNLLTNITLKEDDFLNEIDEFTNNTIETEYNLKIPPPKADANWTGLESNASYLFRLNATCPVAQVEEDNDEDAEPLVTQNYITAYADVIVHTDSLPILNALDVTPKQGIALKTLFQFIYKDNGSNPDYPILYKIGYFLKDEIIFISSLLGVTNTKTVLPYLNDGVKTVLEGCNTHSLCSKVFGPVIVTQIPTISEQDHKNLIEHLRELIAREEYYKMFTYSLAILQTYNSTNNKNLITSMENFISNLTSQEIKRLLMKNADGDTTWMSPANNLMKNIRLLLDKFSASQILLNNIVALRNELSRKNNLRLQMGKDDPSYISRRLLMIDDATSTRIKRDAEKMTLEEVKNYLAISELIITTSPDRKRVEQERQNLMNQVDKFMPGLCASLYQKSRTMNLELKTLILSVEKINRNTFNRYIHILFPENTWQVNGRIKLGRCFTEKLNMDDQLCLGKIVYKNYLTKKGFVYMVKIYDVGINDQIDLQEVVCDSVLVFPVEEKLILDKEAKCVFWKKYWSQSQCKTLQMKNKAIQCSCSNLGYYSLEYVVPTLTSSTTTSTTSTTTTSSISTHYTIATDTDDITAATTTIEPSTSLQTTISHMASTEIITSTTNVNNFTTKISTTIDSEIVESITEISTKSNDVSDNVSLATLHTFQSENHTVHYFIIGTSVCGMGLVLYGIKRLLSNDVDQLNDDVPKYAPLYHEEMLQDLPQMK